MSIFKIAISTFKEAWGIFRKIRWLVITTYCLFVIGIISWLLYYYAFDFKGINANTHPPIISPGDTVKLFVADIYTLKGRWGGSDIEFIVYPDIVDEGNNHIF